MSNIKMSEVFHLPIYRYSVNAPSMVLRQKDNRGTAVGMMNNERYLNAAMVAINSHDSLVEALNATARELNSYIKAENSRLKSNICSGGLDDPDYHDQQTVHEAFKLLNDIKVDK